MNRDDAFAPAHHFTDVHRDRRVLRDEHVHARAELHDAEPLPRPHFVTAGEPADDAARQHADNLPRHDRLAAVIDPDLAALVDAACVVPVRREKASGGQRKWFRPAPRRAEASTLRAACAGRVRAWSLG